LSVVVRTDTTAEQNSDLRGESGLAPGVVLDIATMASDSGVGRPSLAEVASVHVPLQGSVPLPR
jgi:hypothetical protein